MNATIEITDLVQTATDIENTEARETTGGACCGTTEFLHRWFCTEAPHDLCEMF